MTVGLRTATKIVINTFNVKDNLNQHDIFQRQIRFLQEFTMKYVQGELQSNYKNAKLVSFDEYMYMN